MEFAAAGDGVLGVGLFSALSSDCALDFSRSSMGLFIAQTPFFDLDLSKSYDGDPESLARTRFFLSLSGYAELD